jgi:3-dehydroquinate synthase
MLPHPIKLSEDPGAYLRLFIQKKGYTKVAVLTDENTVKHCYPLLLEYLPPHFLITIKSGEENKTLTTCDDIWSEMTRHFLDRHSVLIVVGGGVLGDMGGFCAATYKRGIDFILIPTTLLAMADASIGGKLAIDFKGFKNHIGLFQEPALNLIHQDFLKTLPEEELRSGFAEVIKHALISDRQLWDELRANTLENQPWEILLRHSAELKSSVVAQDPRESGLRKILNVGHTIGHALESFRLDIGTPILHGEAVAFGLVCEAYIAHKQNLLSEAERNEIIAYILNTFGKVAILEDYYKDEISGLCRQDKKNKDNVIYMALLDGIGKARWDCEVTEDTIVESLTFYQSLQI